MPTELPLRMDITVHGKTGKLHIVVTCVKNIPDGMTGIRYLNKLYLSPSTFREYHQAHCGNDFETIRRITNRLTDGNDPVVNKFTPLLGI